MPEIDPPSSKAQSLLRVIVESIKTGRIRGDDPRTFLTYAETLELLGKQNSRTNAGWELKRAGLHDLDAWTVKYGELPKIAALIVTQKTRMPGRRFFSSHGHEDDPHREGWWLQEADRAILYDWTPFLPPTIRYRRTIDQPEQISVQEGEIIRHGDIITTRLGQRDGRAYIRGMRITVGDILGWLAAGMSEREIIRNHPGLAPRDIRASLAYAANQQKRTAKPRFTARWMGKFTLPAANSEDARRTFLLDRYERGNK